MVAHYFWVSFLGSQLTSIANNCFAVTQKSLSDKFRSPSRSHTAVVNVLCFIIMAYLDKKTELMSTSFYNKSSACSCIGRPVYELRLKVDIRSDVK